MNLSTKPGQGQFFFAWRSWTRHGANQERVGQLLGITPVTVMGSGVRGLFWGRYGGIQMARISIGRLSEKQREVFAKLKLEVKEQITPQEFETVATDYLDRHNLLHLATSRDNIPRSTTLEYCHDGLAVHIFSEGGEKIGNIKRNPVVSYTIADPYTPMEDFFGAEGMQVWGRASLFRKNDDPERFAAAWRHSDYAKHPDLVARQGLADMIDVVNFNVITVVPDKIRYTCARKGYRGVVWQREG